MTIEAVLGKTGEKRTRTIFEQEGQAVNLGKYIKDLESEINKDAKKLCRTLGLKDVEKLDDYLDEASYGKWNLPTKHIFNPMDAVTPNTNKGENKYFLRIPISSEHIFGFRYVQEPQAPRNLDDKCQDIEMEDLTSVKLYSSNPAESPWTREDLINNGIYQRRNAIRSDETTKYRILTMDMANR